MISGRPGGEHLSGSIRHTEKETHVCMSAQPFGLHVVIVLIRMCKVFDGPYHRFGLVYQSQQPNNYTRPVLISLGF